MKGCVTMPLLQQNKEYTIDDIYALPDGQRAELIDGQMYMMAPPTRRHQQILLSLSRKIADYIERKGGSCEVDIAPFAVFLTADDKNYVEPDISVICNPDKLTDKGCTGAPDWILSLREAGEQTTIPSCSNTVLPEFVNTGLLIQRKTGSWFIRLSPTIPRNILSPRLPKPGSMMIWRLISVQ